MRERKRERHREKMKEREINLIISIGRAYRNTHEGLLLVRGTLLVTRPLKKMSFSFQPPANCIQAR